MKCKSYRELKSEINHEKSNNKGPINKSYFGL